MNPAPMHRLTLFLVGLTFHAGRAEAQRTDHRAAMDAVRGRGVTLLCRHAMTNDFREHEPVDYEDRSTQRLLSPEGEQQARRIGDALRSLGLTPVELVASPMHRAFQTVERMFEGRPITIDSAWHTNGRDFSGPPSRRRAAVLSTPVHGGNRLIVSHIGTMRNALGRLPGDVREGDCVVVRPNGDSHEVLGIIPWRAWLRAARDTYLSFLKSVPPISLVRSFTAGLRP